MTQPTKEEIFNGCKRKRYFPTRARARWFRKNRRKGKAKGLQIYRCRYCAGWHLGH